MEDQVKELYGRMDQMQEGVNELKDQKVHGNDEQGKKGSRRRLTRGGVTWLLKANRLFPKVCISTPLPWENAQQRVQSWSLQEKG